MYKSIRLGVILSKSPDLEAYMKWGYENGITMNKLVYPVRFPPGYIGTMALEQINPGEIIGSVPNSLLFSSKKAEESELSGLFQEKNFFFNKGDPNYEDMVLITYFIWEKFKGKSSKWYYFIKNQPESPETLQDWSIEELQQLQDEDLIYDTKRALESTIRVWESWKNAVASSGLFSPSMVEYKEFFIVYRLLSSRTFSKFVPYKTFGPIIEYLNHHNMSTTYYYGDKTIQHAVEGARRYERFRDGDDYDSELITEKPVYRPTCQRLLELKNLNIDAQKSFSKLLKEAEDIDNSDKLYLEQKKIWTPQVIQESEDKNLMIITGNEIYESGSEVYLTYGRDSNRTLLATYGFALQNNCYDYASLRIPLHKLCTKDKAHQVEAKDKSRIYEFKFKSNFCCKEYLRTIRALNWDESLDTNSCFSPASVSLERKVVEIALEVLTSKLNSYETTLEQDTEMMNSPRSIRHYFAIVYRYEIKSILNQQIKYLKAIEMILRRISEGFPLDKWAELLQGSLNSEETQQALEIYIRTLKSNLV